MPIIPTDYSKTIIYKIVCKDLQIKYCYVGHTTNFTCRKNSHKYRCNNGFNFKIYQIIRDNGGWNNWDMIEIEKYNCSNSNEATKREREWCEKLNSEMNSRSPTLNIENQKQTSKTYLALYNKTLTEEQKIKKREYNTNWKQLNIS